MPVRESEPEHRTPEQSQRVAGYVEAYGRLLIDVVGNADLAKMRAGDVFALPLDGESHRIHVAGMLRQIGL